MEFRKVTDLEKISELSDSSYILVIENDTAKQISKGDAKFGGGVTTFYTPTSVAPSSLAANDKPVVLNNDTETEANTEAKAKTAAKAGIATLDLSPSDGTLYVDEAMTQEVTAAEAWAAACAGTVRIAEVADGMVRGFLLAAIAEIYAMSDSGEVTRVRFETAYLRYLAPPLLA